MLYAYKVDIYSTYRMEMEVMDVYVYTVYTYIYTVCIYLYVLDTYNLKVNLKRLEKQIENLQSDAKKKKNQNVKLQTCST